MLPDQAMQAAFPLRRLQKLATTGINDLGAIKSESAELPQAAMIEKTQQGNRAALAKTAPIPKAPKLNAPAPKPLEMSMPKIAALNKLQLLLTKQADAPVRASNISTGNTAPSRAALLARPSSPSPTTPVALKPPAPSFSVKYNPLPTYAGNVTKPRSTYGPQPAPTPKTPVGYGTNRFLRTDQSKSLDAANFYAENRFNSLEAARRDALINNAMSADRLYSLNPLTQFNALAELNNHPRYRPSSTSSTAKALLPELKFKADVEPAKKLYSYKDNYFLGSTPISRQQFNTEVQKFLAKRDAMPTYADVAIPAARAYRQKLVQPNTPAPFAQQIDDETLNRKVDVNTVPIAETTGFKDNFSPAGIYYPDKDIIELDKNTSETNPSHTRDQTVPHELTHAAQRRGARYGLAPDLIQEKKDLEDAMIGLNFEKPDYYSDPEEFEAYLAQIKRDHFKNTGELIDSPGKALRAIMSGRLDERSSFNNNLQNVIHKYPKDNAHRQQLLDYIMRKMPGLVSNQPQLKVVQANLAQPVANSGLLPAAPNITTTTPIQRANNLHADKTNGNGVGGNMNPGSARVNSVIDDIGPLSTVGSINGNAGQGVRDGMGKLALQWLAAKIFK